jgi:hypothetical protein
MRQVISGLVAAAAVMVAGAAPAMACGFGGCSPCGDVSPCASAYAPTYSYGYGAGYGCNTGCGGWGYERLAAPATQYYLAYPTTRYYYVNQGPTYTGPGAFAPYPTYQENAVVAPGEFAAGHYGYGAAAVGAYPYHRPYYRPYRYGYGPRYGYLPRVNYGYYSPRYGYVHRYMPSGHRPLRTYY